MNIQGVSERIPEHFAQARSEWNKTNALYVRASEAGLSCSILAPRDRTRLRNRETDIRIASRQ